MKLSFIKTKALMVHFELIGLEYQGMVMCYMGFRNIWEKTSLFSHFYLWDFDHRDWGWNLWKWMLDIFLEKLTNWVVLRGRRALLVNRSIIIIRCNSTPIVVNFVLETIRAGSKTKVGSSMDHVHCKWMTLTKKKFVLLKNFFCSFSSPFLSPMGHPSRINLST